MSLEQTRYTISFRSSATRPHTLESPSPTHWLDTEEGIVKAQNAVVSTARTFGLTLGGGSPCLGYEMQGIARGASVEEQFRSRLVESLEALGLTVNINAGVDKADKLPFVLVSIRKPPTPEQPAGTEPA